MKGLSISLLVLFTMCAADSDASYSQFCEFRGEPSDHPRYDKGTIKFTLKVTSAVEVKHSRDGAGFGGCEREVGKVIEVCLVEGDYGDEEFRKGKSTVVFRSSMDFEVNGETQRLSIFGGATLL